MTARPAILDRLKGVQRAGNGWVAFCPSHPDRDKRSLSIGVGEDGRTLINCLARKCQPQAIVTAVDMTLGDLRGANATKPERRREVAAYAYHDERGELLYQVVRYEPKDFRPRRPDGRGGWIWNLKDVRRVVYRLPELAEQRRVYLAEGEKDVDRLWALGVPATTTHGGAASWRDEYAQQIRDAGVEEVVAVPDNDAAGRGYARRAVATLLRLGVSVRVLELPGLSAGGDVSDWIEAGHGADELAALAERAPVAVDSQPTVPEREPLPDATGPQLIREGVDLALAWPRGVRFDLTNIRDGRDGVRGELTVTQDGRRLSWSTFALSSVQAREALRKKLEAAAPGPPWADYLEDVAYRLTHAAREGEPLVTLTGVVSSPTRELLPGFLYEGDATQIFADGDTGKSLVALTIAAAVQSGAALPFGLKPSRAAAAAYLDWETSRDTLEGRLARIAAGLGIDVPAITYKRMTRPLVDEAAALAAEFARRGIGLVIVDSMMFAVAGGDGAAFHEPITAFYNALRLFAPAATLVLNHVTGADARGNGPARPFGGAFAWNGPRLVWEAKRDQDVTDATAIGFTCRKANNLPRKPEPFGLRFVPGADTITVFPYNLAEASPGVVTGNLAWRIRLRLADGPRTAAELAEELDADVAAVRKALQREKQRDRVVLLESNRWGLPQR